jgi:hypothetical protein
MNMLGHFDDVTHDLSTIEILIGMKEEKNKTKNFLLYRPTIWTPTVRWSAKLVFIYSETSSIDSIYCVND